MGSITDAKMLPSIKVVGGIESEILNIYNFLIWLLYSAVVKCLRYLEMSAR